MKFQIQKTHCINQQQSSLFSGLCRCAMAILLGLMIGLPNVAHAEGDHTGITVQGAGTVKNKPSEVEIGAMVSGEAELTNDAMVKFRDAKKRALAAIEAMKIKDLTVEANGLSVGQALDPNAQQMIMNGRAANMGKPKIQVSESLKIVVKNIDKLETGVLMDTLMKIIDSGRDAGLQIGPPTPMNYYQMQQAMQNGGAQSMMQFKVADSKAIREEAYKQAMEDAKSKAQRLADLAGVKLGKIISIQDSGPAAPQPVYNPYGYMQTHESDPSELTNQMLTDIPLKVGLTVQFEIQK